MGELLMAILTGAGFPALMLVVSRYYKENPNEWEMVALAALVGAGALVAGFWVMSMEAFSDGSLGRFLVVLLAGWTCLFGLGVLCFALFEGADAVRKTRQK